MGRTDVARGENAGGDSKGGEMLLGIERDTEKTNLGKSKSGGKYTTGSGGNIAAGVC